MDTTVTRQITRQTALQHCRTCLRNLVGNVAYDMEETPNLTNWLERLLPLVSLYRGEGETDYPHLVCLSCYDKLREFNEFHDSVCASTDVLDGIFNSDCTVVGSTNANGIDRIIASQLIDLNGIEYLNGRSVNGGVNSSSIINIKRCSNASEGESTDTCSETEESVRRQIVIKQEDQKETGLHKKTHAQASADTSAFMIPAQSTTTTTASTLFNRKSYKCSKCERKFLDKYSCIMHIRHCQLFGHQDECYECEICHKNYQKIGHLNRHKLMEHEDVCQLMCEYSGCNFIFRQNIFRQRHYDMFHQNETKRLIINSSGNCQDDVNGNGNGNGNDNRQDLISNSKNNWAGSTKTRSAIETSTSSSSLLSDIKIEAINADNELIVEETEYIDKTVDDTMTVDAINEDINPDDDADDREDGQDGHDDEDIEEDDHDEYPMCDVDPIDVQENKKMLTSVSKPYRGNCPLCRQEFKLGKELRTHITTVHETELKYVCDICDRKFLYQSYLNSHMIAAHAEKTLPCTHCSKVFKTNAELRKHIVRIHQGVKPYECRFCLTKFGVRASRDRHELIHTGERPYTCDVCYRTFSYAHTLKKHKASHDKEHQYDLETEEATKAL